MKIERIIGNVSKSVKTFLLASVVIVVMAGGTYANYIGFKDGLYTLDSSDNLELNIAASTMLNKSDMKQLKETSVEIAYLQEVKTRLMDKLEKAKAERDKNHGLVAAICHQPSKKLKEIVALEGQIGRLDSKIASLEKQERNIAQKCNGDIRWLAVR